MGDGDARVGAAIGGGQDARREETPREIVVREAEIEQEPRESAGAPSRDFRINESHRVGAGGLKEKARANITAIRALKQIEADNRAATEAEKAALVRYAGWGALSQVFHPYPSAEWRDLAQEVRELLEEPEYDSARGSTPNAHYTSPDVIAAMWAGLERLGLARAAAGGAQILEPSMGVGHFFGLMPEELASGCRRTGVELDSITARIARQLYPDAAIFAKGFEETALPDDFFDAVVGNIPFGDYPVHDPAYPRAVTRAIHDYFLAKSLDKLRPGGVMALITSRYTMDKRDGTLRRYLAARADLVGAVRLPNTAFKGNAGTEVTADILFLQKREKGAAAQGGAWEALGLVEAPDGAVEINEYFARHPEMMLGEMRLEGTMYRAREPTLAGEFSAERLREAIAKLPADIWRIQARAPGSRAPPDLATDISDPGEIKDGAYGVRDNRLVIRRGGTFEIAKVSANLAWRIRGLLGVRDAVRDVFRTQLEDASAERITQARRDLNQVYDAFARRFGPLSSRENFKAFAGDPDQPLLLSLENYDAAAKRATKTAIFERRTLARYEPVSHVETAAEALAISLNETGVIDWPRMEQVTGRKAQGLQRELGRLVFRNPEGGGWETADRYLSGDVRRKLTEARAASGVDPAYARNVEALEEVQPADLLPGDIEARLGSSWIPAADIEDFLAQLLGIASRHVDVGHAAAIATWSVRIDATEKDNVSNTTTYGTGRFSAAELVEDALNGRVPTAYDKQPDGSHTVNQQETIAAREKQQQLKDRFREWIWEDAGRAARLARAYNDRFNNLRLRAFDGSHLKLSGMNRAYLRDGDLAGHQKDAVWRIVESGSTLLAHVVGAGKTWTMAAAAMEMRRMGLCKKPMFVVPNHLVVQWGAEFVKLYPQARLFVAGKESFAAANRKRAMARIASGTYDAVIVSHRSFEFLPVSDKLFGEFVQKQVEALEEAILDLKADGGDNRHLVKDLEKAKKRFVAKLKAHADREHKDDAISFEELGVDQIFVDEADLYKNLFYTTKMSRVAGLPNTESNRAFDMYMKTRYLRERNGGRGVVFATGTPVSNTMAEMYTMLRYLAPDLLEERGLAHFDAWAANFADAVTALELAPDGSGYRMHTRFAKFVNLPELLSMFRSFADVKTAEDLKLPCPTVAGGKPEVVAAPAGEELKAYIKTLIARAERLRTARVDPSEDNMLKITGDGRKAALDMRLVGSAGEADYATKVGLAVSRVRRIWEATRETKGAQLVFCDLSTPDRSSHPGRFNVYEDLKTRLAGEGVPEGEIAFIHDAETDAEKKLLFDDVNAGRVRILIGSTEKMGAGTNVQRRLAALHHLDAPWRPRDIEQREGRILRQGNMNGEVRILRYVTEGSFDAYMWQTLETKARFIQQVMRGETSVRAAEDVNGGALTYAEIKAIASGNPAVMEKVKVDTEIRKLDQLRAAHLNQQYRIRLEVQALPEQIEEKRKRIERLAGDIARRDAHETGEFSMSVGARIFSGKDARAQGGTALALAVLADKDDTSLQVRGDLRGFEILSRGVGGVRMLGSDDEAPPELFIRGEGTYRAHVNVENPLGTVQSLERTLSGLDKALEDEREHLARAEKALADFQGQMGRRFEQEDRLKELLHQQEELNAALDLDKNERQVAPVEETSNGEGGADGGEDGIAPGARKRSGAGRGRYSRNESDDEEVDDENEPVPARPVSRPGL